MIAFTELFETTSARKEAIPLDGRIIDSELQLIALARETGIPELHAEIYSFNTQSQAMFQSVGFVQTEPQRYSLRI